MGITKISALFAANVDSVKNKQLRQQPIETAPVEKAAAEEAVTLSPSFSSQGDDSSARASRVSAIKSQVAAGLYKPSSQDVATALARDLF